MNREDIIRMAKESGMEQIIAIHEDGTRTVELPDFVLLERFAALAFAAGVAAERERRAFELAECYRCGWDGGVKAERDACARLCEEEKALRLAEMIQARGEK
jgi:hypothetical protein